MRRSHVIGTLFAFVIVCGGVWIMRRTQPDLPRPFKTPLVPVVAILGMLWNFAMMYSLGPDNWTRLVVWLVIGQIIFFTYGRRHSKLRGGEAAAYTLLDRALSFANIGFLVGGAVGFLMRPEGLNLEAVISRGVNLKDPVLTALAQSSFNHMVLWALAGAGVGAAVGYALHKFTADVG